MQRLTCPCCLAEAKLELRFDKLSRPYGVCTSCQVKMFFRGTESIVGLSHLSPVAAALAKKIATDQDEWRRLQTTRTTVEEALRAATTLHDVKRQDVVGGVAAPLATTGGA